jgi:branched-chain amino acid transport system substrate-binding protein
LIATDLAMQGSSRTQTLQVVGAVRYMLQQQGWKAGDKNVALQVCDDSTAQAAKWDSGKCNQNAKAEAADPDLVAVIGTFNSGCAAIEIPIANQAPGGGLAMVSPANTYVCLTTGGGDLCSSTEPGKYYPNGKRNYARVVAHDAYQGAADAQNAQELGVKSVYILNDKEAYGLGIAENFRDAAQKLGIKIAGFAAWDPKASNYQALMQKIKGTGADALFLGGLICENGAQIIKDKVAVLGPNTGAVKLLAPDGFTTQSTIDEAGKKNAADMYSSVAGVPAQSLTGAGKKFVDGYTQTLGGKPLDPYAVYGAQAAQVVLSDIANSDGSRAGVLGQLLKTDINGAILGQTFKFDPNGDPLAQTVKITVYKAGDTFAPFKTISPPADLVKAAAGLQG